MMERLGWRSVLLAAAFGLSAGPVFSQTNAGAQPGKKASMTEAKGSFEIKMTPAEHGPGEALASYALDKIYHGDLEGTARGEMLSAGDPKSGNAGYVALERVTGKIGGHTGSFALMQSGTMTAGTPPEMTARIVPGSGTGELSGIFGTLTIQMAGGKHEFMLSYGFSGVGKD